MNLKPALLAVTLAVAGGGGLATVFEAPAQPLDGTLPAMPEPGAGALLVAGLAAAGFLAGRRREPR